MVERRESIKLREPKISQMGFCKTASDNLAEDVKELKETLSGYAEDSCLRVSVIAKESLNKLNAIDA